MEYQKTNERQRKDMEGLRDEKEKIVKDIEVHKMLLKSALAEKDKNSDDSEDEREKRRYRRKHEMQDEGG